MKSYITFLLYILANLFLFAQQQKFSVPFSFTENKGQIYDQNYSPNPEVLYLLNMQGLNVQLKKNGFSYDLYERDLTESAVNERNIPFSHQESTDEYLYHFHRIDFEFLNFNPDFETIENDAAEGVENYYLEHIPQGVHNVKSYRKIIYKNFYNHIDIEFITTNDGLKPFEYNFILHPGSDIRDIRFKIEGAESGLTDGSIDIKVSFGTLRETIPASWFKGNENKLIGLKFSSYGSGIYGFESNPELSENLNKSTLIIDPVPVRLWGTYYGVNGVDAFSIIYSLRYYNGAVYAGGYAVANGMATSGTFQSTYNGSYDGVLAKFSDDGHRIWATYCGSTNQDSITDLDFDQNGNIYVTGFQLNGSSILGTSGTHQPEKNNYNDGFIVKFDTTGNRIWGTYFGGEQNDYLYAVKVDNATQTLFVGGDTNSGMYIATPNAHQISLGSTPGDSDSGYFGRFDLDGIRIWSSYYGGGYADGILDIALDSENNLIIGGIANSLNNISTLNSYNGGVGDSFLAKFTIEGVRLWGTYVGGTGSDYMKGIDINSSDEIIIAGYTTSPELATSGVFLEDLYSDGFFDYSGFAVKMNKNGEKLWGTYCGGYGSTQITGVRFNQSGEIIVEGRTDSKTYIASENGYDTTKEGLSNAYLIKFNESGQRIWGTYYGGDFGVGYGYSLDLNEDYIYLAGTTTFKSGIATPGTYQSVLPFSGYNAFIVKFRDCESNTAIDIIGHHCEGDSFTIEVSGGNSYEWYGPNGYLGNGSSILIEDFDESDTGEYFIFIENGDCSEVRSFMLKFAGEEPPVPDLPLLPQINAVCSVTLTPPTATDDCLGTIQGTTDSPLYYDIPGVYIITWKYSDNFDNEVYQNQKVTLEAGDDFMVESAELTLCENEPSFNLRLVEPDLTESGIENIVFEYYETMEDMLNNHPIPNPENYSNPQHLDFLYVKGSADDCSDYSIIYLELTEQPVANSINPTVCDNDNDGAGLILLSNYISQICPQQGVAVSFYEDAGHTAQIDPDTGYEVGDGDVIYVLAEAGHCQNESILTVSLSDYSLVPASDYMVCDDEPGAPYNFNLLVKSEEIGLLLNTNPNQISYYFSLEDARNSTSPLAMNYQNQSNPQTIYAGWVNPEGCPEIVSFALAINQNPIWDQPDSYQKCAESEIELTAPAGYTYYWSTGETGSQITVSEEGTYTVQLSNEHCTIEKEITVTDLSAADFAYIYENGIFKILTDPELNLEYSLDGIFWQQSPYFYQLEVNREYQIWLRTTSGCIQKVNVYVYDKLPNFISPNGDGKNDYWDISFLRNVMDIRIFDRFGKVIFQVKGDAIIPWDGKYMGRELPSDTYWYVIRFLDDQKLTGSIHLRNY